MGVQTGQERPSPRNHRIRRGDGSCLRGGKNFWWGGCTVSRFRSKKRSRRELAFQTTSENELAGGFRGDATARGWPSQYGDDDALDALDHPPEMRSEREVERLESILDQLATGRGK